MIGIFQANAGRKRPLAFKSGTSAHTGLSWVKLASGPNKLADETACSEYRFVKSFLTYTLEKQNMQDISLL